LNVPLDCAIPVTIVTGQFITRDGRYARHIRFTGSNQTPAMGFAQNRGLLHPWKILRSHPRPGRKNVEMRPWIRAGDELRVIRELRTDEKLHALQSAII
jgi:hypothetical protein